MKIVKPETSLVEIPFQIRWTGIGITPTAWKSLEFALVRLWRTSLVTSDGAKAPATLPWTQPGRLSTFHLANVGGLDD